jgi:hypothetical protein
MSSSHRSPYHRFEASEIPGQAGMGLAEEKATTAMCKSAEVTGGVCSEYMSDHISFP